IGPFLLRNKYCSLPGLGVFDLKKESSRMNAGDGTVSPPRYTVLFTPVGSIDDTFASFIASSENVSISNASNNIREFCKQVKEQLAKTGSFEIEYLGSFSMQQGKMVFVQSNELDLGAEPAPLPPLLERPKPVETAQTAKSDFSYPPSFGPQRKRKSGIWKLVIWLLVLAALGAGAWFGYRYYTQEYLQTPDEEIPSTQPLPQTDSVAAPADTSLNANPASVQDSLMNDSLPSPSAASPETLNEAIEYNVAILSFDNEAMASSKMNKLKRYGHAVSVVNNNGKFVVAIKASHPLNDTTLLVDSLRRFFNPKGPVYLLK
ncbi:MAG TPA: hypothetical protein PLP34_06630, partial [Chitinophagaceae bacterium]|nr:hypothetical protein [Chitinophagaceae bacterium]